MKKLNLFVGLVAIFSSFAGWASCPDPRNVVERTLASWRSVDRYIDGGVLREEAELFIPKRLRQELVECEQGQLLRQFQNESLKQEWALVAADAENLLKIRKITQHTLALRRPFISIDQPVHGFQNEIVGLPQKEIDRLIEPLGLPEVASVPSAHRSKNQFSFKFHKLKMMSFKSGSSTLIDNDLYAFTVAAIFYNLGWHKSRLAVFENSSRGADSYPFMVSAGQDQVLDILEGARFSRWDIEVIRKVIDRRVKVDPGFYDWLAQWRFRGTVRSVPTGTIIFPKTPVIQVIADPASAIIVESLINPWMSYMTNMATTAVRNMLAAGDIKVVTEAGTRRLVTGHLSAMTGIIGGASGTSNILAAELTGATAYGTMSHASVGMFPTEMAAFEAFTDYFKAPPLLLPDTYHLQTGVRTAIRAAGDRLGSVRQDSNIVNPDGTALSTFETIQEIRNIFESLGHGQWNGVVTNDLTEKSLRALAKSGLDVEVASLGGAFAASSLGVTHGNYVYKLTEVRDVENSSTRFPIKIANGDKSTEPGEKRLYRLTNKASGLFAEDIKLGINEIAPERPGFRIENLISTTFENGKRLARRQPMLETAAFVKEQLAKVDPQLLDGTATRTSLGDRNYKVTLSAHLQDIRTQAIADVTPKSVTRILVIPGSYAPITEEGHLAMAKSVNELFKNQTSPQGFDKIIFIPTGDNPVHGRKYVLSNKARLERLQRAIKDLPNAEVYLGEIENGGAYTIDSLKTIQALYPEAKIELAFGDDAFWSIGRKNEEWKEADQILLNYGIVVVKREGKVRPSDVDDTRALLKRLGFEERPNGFLGPIGKSEDPVNHRIEFFSMRTNNTMSATGVREFYDKQGFSALAHVTDPLWTFAKRSRLPHGDQQVDGTLAVEGTELTIDKINRLVSDILDSGLMKLSLSADAHHEEEVANADLNGEFHAPTQFPKHGMIGRDGPEGNRLIAELEQTLSRHRLLEIPAHEPKQNDGQTEMALIPFDLNAADVRAQLARTNDVTLFHKNGVGSHSVTANPRYDEYLNLVDPYKVLPHFHFGWCTDFCDYWIMRHELERGYNVIFIVDAAVGVGKKTTGKRMRELLSLGLKVMTTEEFITLNAGWKSRHAKWHDVLNDLADWQPTSSTESSVREELTSPAYTEEPVHDGDVGESCAIFLTSEAPRL